MEKENVLLNTLLLDKSIQIRDIAYYLPESIITNEQLSLENPSWDIKQLEERIGVKERHIAGGSETALDLAVKACEKLFLNHPDLKPLIDGIIFCTQSGDHIMPPNSCILHGRLKLHEEVFAFDFNLACSGYVYGLVLARGLMYANNAKHILLVNADTYSKYINPQDRSVRILFGDGAAVTWISSCAQGTGVIDVLCATSGLKFDSFIIPAGGCRMPKSILTSIPKIDENGNVRTLENIHMKGMDILVFVNSRIPKQIRQILERNNLTVDDIDLFIFHQASKLILDSLVKTLQIKPERTYQNINRVGNTVSASIPIALKEAKDLGLLKTGSTILLCGFGVGLSWGSAIVKCQ